MNRNNGIKIRSRASFIHLCISLAVALVAAGLVFWLWYPAPHHRLSGGLNLFLMLTGIDLIVGPILTFVVFNTTKPRRELVRDLTVIAIIQLAALSYGLNTAFHARPTHIVFEYNRFRVVHADAEIPQEMLEKAPTGINTHPLAGPIYVSLRPIESKERTDILVQELSGFPVAYRADMWQPYDAAKNMLIESARPVSELPLKIAAEDMQKVQQKIAVLLRHEPGKTEKDFVYLPLLSRFGMGIALLPKDSTHVLGILEVDFV